MKPSRFQLYAFSTAIWVVVTTIAISGSLTWFIAVSASVLVTLASAGIAYEEYTAEPPEPDEPRGATA